MILIKKITGKWLNSSWWLEVGLEFKKLRNKKGLTISFRIVDLI